MYDRRMAFVHCDIITPFTDRVDGTTVAESFARSVLHKRVPPGPPHGFVQLTELSIIIRGRNFVFYVYASYIRI